MLNNGLVVIELEGLAPVPFVGMMLADVGARVILIKNPNLPSIQSSIMHRRKEVVELDLKQSNDCDKLRSLLRTADILLDPYRPGTLERMGLDPAEQLIKQVNPRLICGRLTGFGQTSSMAKRAGHDINFVAQSGVLSLIGRPGQKPTIPLNLLGDFGGGSLIMFSALLLALMQRQRTGRGQVIDLSMTTGLVYLSTYIHEMKPVFWPNGRGENPLDGAAPFYDCYECSDGKYLAVGAVEPKFYQKFIDCLVQSCGDITNTDDLNMLYHSGQHDAQKWPAMKRLIEQCLMTKTRDEWLALFDPLDCCVNAVMEWDELESRLPQGTFDKSTDGRLIPRFPVKSKL